MNTSFIEKLSHTVIECFNMLSSKFGGGGVPIISDLRCGKFSLTKIKVNDKLALLETCKFSLFKVKIEFDSKAWSGFAIFNVF